MSMRVDSDRVEIQALQEVGYERRARPISRAATSTIRAIRTGWPLIISMALSGIDEVSLPRTLLALDFIRLEAL